MRKEGDKLILTLDDYYYPWKVVFLEDLDKVERDKVEREKIIKENLNIERK